MGWFWEDSDSDDDYYYDSPRRGYTFNPETGYEIEEMGSTHDDLVRRGVINYDDEQEYEEDEKILNPDTNRWVYWDGAVGREVRRKLKRRGREPIRESDMWGFDRYYSTVRPEVSIRIIQASPKDALKLSSQTKEIFVREAGLEYQNRKCEMDDLGKCSEKVKGMQIGQIIGEGDYGAVYKGKAVTTMGNVDITIKRMHFTENNLDAMNVEVAYAQLLGKMGIGPKVWDAFYYDTGSGLEQVIVMEGFDMDIGGMVNKYAYSNTERVKKGLYSCMKLLHEQIFKMGLFCYSLRSNNFLYRVGDEEVRMIDFGAYHCEKSDASVSDRNALYFILLCQLSIFIKLHDAQFGFQKYFEEGMKQIKDNPDYYAKNILTFFNKESKLKNLTRNNINMSINNLYDVKRMIREASGIN